VNLKLKRLVRTTSSEQYALFDLDQIDEEDQLPLTIGKLDLHYTGEGVYGTILLWDETTRQLKTAQRQDFIYALLDEISQPMGVPNEYVVEFFAPTLDHYEVFHNVGVGEPDASGQTDHGQDGSGPDSAAEAVRTEPPHSQTGSPVPSNGPVVKSN
jgi:hypothetical protein